MESAILEKNDAQDRFYVLSFYEERRGNPEKNVDYDVFNIISQRPPLSDFINGVVCFNPKNDEHKLANVTRLLDEISKWYSDKTL